MSAPSQPVGQKVSHYRILRKIGGGGMGVVYKSEDLQPRSQCCVGVTMIVSGIARVMPSVA